MARLLNEWRSVVNPVIGMVHLPPLPGSPKSAMRRDELRSFVLRDAEALVNGGVSGLMVENLGDSPYFPAEVPPSVVAMMTYLAGEIRTKFPVLMGINVLRNDALSGLAIAHAVGAQFIRVNVLCGARVTDQGLIQGIAHRLLRERKLLGGEDIGILADIDVKHSAPLGPRSLREEAQDTAERGGADGLIVSGASSGSEANLDELAAVRQAASGVPVLVGSGITVKNVTQWLSVSDGLIVGSTLKQDGNIQNPVDIVRVRELIARVKERR